MADQPRLTTEDLHQAMGDQERAAREDSYWKAQNKRLHRELDEQQRTIDLLTTIDSQQVRPSPFGKIPKTKAKSRGIVNLVLSDMHFDETVLPEQVNGLNAYDRHIAGRRLKQTIHKTIRLTRDLTTGITFDGAQVWLGGDNISGDIHDELKRTNQGQGVTDSIDYWTDPLAGALLALADAYGRVHVTCTFGNHARSTKKPEAKSAIRSSFDWLLCRMISRALAHDDRITWTIPESLLVIEAVYGTRYLFEHGDNFKGGDQIAGPIRPVMFGADKRRKTLSFNKMITCHFHQYADIPAAVMNGSLVGFNEYSNRRGFKFEPPKQAFWIETPENGPMFSTAIKPCDPVAEGWA